MTAGALSHRLTRLGRAAGVEHAALHRLRHGVATYLVGQGMLLKAQARLGHGDPATTLRHYSHAIPLDDADVADQLGVDVLGVATMQSRQLWVTE